MFTKLPSRATQRALAGLRTNLASLSSPQASRAASQLYPTTSERWDAAMLQAESIVGDASSFSSLQKWVSGEFNNITKYLQRLVGTNHPMLETAKRCTYISEGKMGSAQARGLTVMLTSKAVGELMKHSCTSEKQLEEVLKNQMSLAEMTEMTYSAYMIHRGVMDLKMHGLESTTTTTTTTTGGLTEQRADLEVSRQARALHYGNKVSVLCGDFLLAYVMRGLGDLFSSKVVDLVASAITDFMEGEFMLLDDWRSANYLLSREARDLSRWVRRSHSTIGSLQGNTCQASLVLANIQAKLQYDARELGRNLGLAWQAHTELQPFLRERYEPIELPEMPPYPAFDLNCLPVLLFLRGAHDDKARNFRLLLDEIKSPEANANANSSSPQAKTDGRLNLINQHEHQELVNYGRLHELVLADKNAIGETYKLIRSHSTRAIKHLDSFPPSESKEVLVNICESLYQK
ncbi:decaprenyl-diphosphate synthase subunit 2 [Olea europaea subsp. europaea]|uniref:Decaprenyl-diphosphate synthase subunit 2 n=1 Tax=Olea europaea subsp. europaea TaxID=158383 RepID=A0A8S0ULE6_OLEEU|nr:decaprenyl-diphosphate synthase subunit 2 [Olea europaea subsp. europaea]